ncbi:DUF3122 domain-containing protein [Anabaena cylindrica FACHB-243]|nr:DUF3122 domain-containing protein [Anabaena cylindrica FACHB-243]MBY5281654.1 DUF3122 domain-containing protein [Anabaena sp. CCAP 1446/1C]MBY5309180.1 DUF3122 domain-containing protein [Anabaena sp. CCAP 1446/1C]
MLLLVILTAFIFLDLGDLTFQKANAAITQLEEAPGEFLYRSQVKLDDQSGKVWQVVLFKQIYPGQASNINLRLIGFPGSAKLIHPQPLKITSETGKVWKAADVFLDEAPAPTIGEYDLTNILPELPDEKLTLGIPLPGSNFIKISVPASVVKEWRTVLIS